MLPFNEGRPLTRGFLTTRTAGPLLMLVLFAGVPESEPETLPQGASESHSPKREVNFYPLGGEGSWWKMETKCGKTTVTFKETVLISREGNVETSYEPENRRVEIILTEQLVEETNTDANGTNQDLARGE